MKRIYLFCSAGMSTSILSAAMQKVADSYNLDIEVKAFSEKIIDDIVATKSPDVILLGPQVLHMLGKVSAKYAEQRPVMVISASDYGTANGEAVLKAALLALKKFNEQKGELK